MLKKNKEMEKILKVLKIMTQILLESGAETYRIENISDIISRVYNQYEIETIALPTSIYITISSDKEDEKTIIKRIKDRNIDLKKINEANKISRLLANKEITLDKAYIKLLKIKGDNKKSKFYKFYEGLAAAFFTLLFKGGIIEFILAFLSGFVVQFIQIKLNNKIGKKFFISFFGSIIISLMAIIATVITPNVNYDIIIIGGIMPMLPGLSMTNAVRDTMSGDLVSGLVRGAEAILVAIALSSGVGIVLSIGFYYKII